MSQESASTAPKARNPMERLLVWGGILLLVGLVFIEYKAKQAYDTSIQGLQDVSNGVRDVTIDEARNLMVGYSKSEGPVPDAEGLDTYHYAWFSLLRGGTYQLTLIADSDKKTLKTFTGPAFAEDPEEVAKAIEAANAENHDTPMPIIGSAPGQGDPEPSPQEEQSQSTSAEQPAPDEASSAPATEPPQ